MKTMFPEARERERAYAAYRKAVTRYAIFLWDPANMYRREMAVTRTLYRSAKVAEAACAKMLGNYVVRTVTLTDAEAGVERP